jgi:site-specific DNA-methyltransferase (adenine-specific)
MKPYYEKDGIVLYHGDCRDVMRDAPVEARHLITDPPYNVSGQHSDENRKDGSLRRLNYSWDGISNNDLVAALKLALACLTGPSNVVCWCGHAQATPIDELLVERGMSTKPLAWVKQCPPPSFGHTRWASGFELAVFGFMAGATWKLNQSGMRPNVIVADALRNGNSERVGHQTQKPLQVMRWVMNPLVAAGETVLDPFAGSGTTLVVAKELGVPAIGIERELAHCEMIVNRLRQGVLFAGGAA